MEWMNDRPLGMRSTLFERLIKWSIVAVGAALVLGVLVGRSVLDLLGVTRSVAQQEAEDWIRRNKIAATADCAASDSDGNGYVSCSFVMHDGASTRPIVPMECAAPATINRGCRLRPILGN